MSEYDFEGELNALYGGRVSPVHYEATLAALRRAHSAGRASVAGGSDLDRLVTLAAAHPNWTTNASDAPGHWDALIAEQCTQLLSALKAQAVKP